MADQKAAASPHVLILPLPLQGPVGSMLKLAELLCLAGIRVTFLNTRHIQQRLLDCSNVVTYFKKYPGFRFEAVPDGLPEDNPRTAEQFSELMESVQAAVGPVFREMLTTGVYGRESGERVSCVIADGILHFALDVGRRIGVPVLFFETISPSGLWSYFCLPQLIQAGEIPIHDSKLDEIITNAPGMEGIMRYRDLPSFCRGTIDYTDPQVALVLNELNNIPLAQGLILNTFQDLEAPVLAQMRKISPNIYAIGPIHAHLKTRLGPQLQPINSNSIWKEDRSCISWLDQQPSKSVLYVSIGSLSVITKDQFFEIWYGLVGSGSRFLWVQRPGSVTGLDKELEVPLELSKGTKERGYIVGWAPQQEVLGHSAVGGFLTHSGWNSTLESIAEGVPMICWPHYVDQFVNSRYVEEVWKVGLDMKDSCDRVTIEKMIRELMELRKDEFLHTSKEMSKLARLSVSRGGSSFSDLDRLIQDIKMMNIYQQSNIQLQIKNRM